MVIEEKDFPWPRNGAHLFVNRQDWYNNAVLNGQRDNLSLYAVGYKRAGEILAEAAVECRRDHDSLVFPMLSGECLFEVVSWQLSFTLERETVPGLSTSNASDLDWHRSRQQPREFEPQEEQDVKSLISG